MGADDEIPFIRCGAVRLVRTILQAARSPGKRIPVGNKSKQTGGADGGETKEMGAAVGQA